MRTFFRESFIPVIFVFAILSAGLIVMSKMAGVASTRETVVQISLAEFEQSMGTQMANVTPSATDPDAAEEIPAADLGQANVIVSRALETARRDSSEAALAMLSTVLARNPQHGSAWFAMGSILSRQDKNSAAVKAYEKAVEFTRGRAKAVPLFNLGCQLQDFGRNVEAGDCFARAIDVRPDYLEARMNLAVLTSRLPDSEMEALEHYNKLLRLYPDYAPGFYNRGVLRLGLSQPDSALTDFQQATTLDSTMTKAWYNQGRLQSRLGRDDLAVQAYRATIATDQNHLKSYRNLVAALERLGRSHEAVTVAQQAVQLDPTYAAAWFALARAYTSLENNSEAMAAYHKVIDLEPGNSKAWLNLGVLYARQSQHQKAAECYREVLDLDPANTTARFNLAVAQGRNQDYPAAEKTYRQVLSLDPEYSRAWQNLGVILAKKSDHRGAIECYQRTLKLKPDNLSAGYNLALEYRRMDRLEEALAQIRAFLDKHPEHNKGKMFLRSTCTRILEGNPGHPEALKALADLDRPSAQNEGI